MKFFSKLARACLIVVGLTTIPFPTSVQAHNESLSLETIWRFKYFDEQAYNSSILLKEDTIDERLSNSILAINAVTDGIGQAVNYADEQIEMLAAGRVHVNESQCQQELYEMARLLEDMESIVASKKKVEARALNETHVRLAQVLDSFGRYEAGGLLGRFNYLGSQSQCVDSQLILPQVRGSPRTDMRYCLAKLKADTHLDPDLRKLDRFKQEPRSLLLVGICIPKSCHSRSFNRNRKTIEKLVHGQFELPKSLFVDQHLTLDSIHCGFEEDSEPVQIPLSGKILITFLAVWLLLMLLATALKSNIRQLELQEVIDALNIRTSLKDLMSYQTHSSQTSRVNLDNLSCVKAVSCMCIVLLHAMTVGLFGSDNILKNFNIIENDPIGMLLMNANIVVDTFFVISGLILSFQGLKRFKTSNSDDGCLVFAQRSFRFALNRYLRLVPLFFLAFWFKRSIMLNIGTSIRRDHGYDEITPIGKCRNQSWFHTLSPLETYHPFTELCFQQTWSIYNDMFHAIVLAPVFVLMIKRPILGATIAMLMALASNFSMFLAFFNIDPTLETDFLKLKMHAILRFFWTHGDIYMFPHRRVFATAIGIIAGCALHHYDTGNLEWPSWFKGPLTIASLVLVPTQFMSPLLIPLARQYHMIDDNSPLNFYFGMATSRLVWCLANAILFMRMISDWRKSQASASGLAQVWRILSRLNYPMLLIHMDLLRMDAEVSTTIRFFSWYGVWISFSSLYLTSIMISIPVHVLLENPIDKILKLVMRKITTYEVGREGKAERCSVFAQQDVVQPLQKGLVEKSEV